jgi:hypothetical protein
MREFEKRRAWSLVDRVNMPISFLLLLGTWTKYCGSLHPLDLYYCNVRYVEKAYTLVEARYNVLRHYSEAL